MLNHTLRLLIIGFLVVLNFQFMFILFIFVN